MSIKVCVCVCVCVCVHSGFVQAGVYANSVLYNIPLYFSMLTLYMYIHWWLSSDRTFGPLPSPV